MKVGLTGGIGAGKSSVARLLRDAGVLVIDADLIAREVVEPGTPGLAAVVAEFGSDVLTPDGALDRSKLGAIVFADEEKRRRLEAILHPLIYGRVEELDAAAPPGAIVVHDLPLLVENDRAAGFEEIIVVDVPTRVQVERLVRDRGMTEAEARSRIEAQATREQRLAVATIVIDNSGTQQDLRDRVTEVLQGLRQKS